MKANKRAISNLLIYTYFTFLQEVLAMAPVLRAHKSALRENDIRGRSQASGELFQLRIAELD
jgi:hypothetical protein